MLIADPGTFTPSTATATYQWLRSGLPIAGATKRGYILRPADVGHPPGHRPAREPGPRP